MSETIAFGVRIVDGVVQVALSGGTGSTLATGADILAQTTSLLAQQNVYAQLLTTDETLTTNSISLDTAGLNLLEVYAIATTATTFTVSISMNNTNWENHYTSSAAELSHITTSWNGFRYIKLSAAVAGVSGTDTVTLILGAK